MKAARCRKRRPTTDDVQATSDPSTTRATKRSRVSPPGEFDENSAGLTRPLATRRRTFGQLQMPVLGAAAASEDVDRTKKTDSSVGGSKKVRYFSNFYRQPEPDEVFVGGRLKVETGQRVRTDQPTMHAGWTTDSRPCLLQSNLPLPFSYSLVDPSSVAVWSRYRFVHGMTTSFPPSIYSLNHLAE